MWEIKSLVCLEPNGWSKFSSLNYPDSMMLKGKLIQCYHHELIWAWLLIFGQVKFQSVTILFLFHQSANVYCPQEVLHLIHNAGWGISAQVSFHMTDNPLYFYSVQHSYSTGHQAWLFVLYWWLLFSAQCSQIEFHCSTVFDLWQEEILQTSPTDSIYNDPGGVYSCKVSSTTSRCPGC